MIKIFSYENKSFNLKKMPTSISKNIDWGRTGDKDATSMHSISSYLAMFTPAMPKYFIKKLTRKGDLIYDPFCGRGTTALKAREMERKFVGSDLNPYALVLSRAKIANVKKLEIFNEISKMESNFNLWIQIKKNVNKYKLKEFEEINIFYSSKVMNQLIFIREKYGQEWRKFNNISNALFGFILGLMHGPSKKDGSSIYFSLSMPNTISMAPNYVKKYSIKFNLKKPKVNIFDLIRDRVEKKFHNILTQKFNSTIFEMNALTKNDEIKDESVKLLITSPPYLNIVNYINSNWLKLWLLGYDRRKMNDIKLSDNLSFDKYVEFIKSFLNNIYLKIKKYGYVAIIVGDIHGEKIIEKVWEIIDADVNFKLKKIYWDTSYLQSKKTTNMLNKKRGKATIIEKVLLLWKDN